MNLSRVATVCAILLASSALVQSADTKPAAKPQKLSASAIQIEPIDTADVDIPAEFRFAIYERLIDRIRLAGTFKTVYRSGDRAAANVPDLVILHTKVSKFKEGSQLKRELTTVTGGTTVDVSTSISSRDGKVLLDKNLSGKVRFFGENLGVTNDLAKRIAKLLSESF